MLRSAIVEWMLISAALAQPASQPFQLDGIVVDQNGHPVAGVWLGHTGNRKFPDAHETDRNGRFSLRTRAPRIVFRKPGFQSEAFTARTAADLRISLTRLNETRKFPSCPGVDLFSKPSEFTFKIPPVPLEFQHGQGRPGFSHGNGYGYGLPPDPYVWQSTIYEEMIYSGERKAFVVDARGLLPNGNRWRFLGTAGESAFYLNINETAARELDRILDRACIQ